MAKRMKRYGILLTLLSGLLFSTLTACTMTSQPIGNPEAPYPDNNPAVGDIVHLPTGVKVTAEQMNAAISDARIIYVGETHDNPASHRQELQVLRAVADRYPGQVSLGMEMFNTSHQEVLDKWVAGELSEKEFLKESDWYSNWQMDFAYYSDLLHYAREAKIPVVGINVSKELRQKVGMHDLDELDEEIRAQLPEMDFDDRYQKAMVESIYAGHGQGPKMFEAFLRVQTLWDESMAESIVRHMADKGQEHRMVVIAGGYHVRHGFGIPRRVYRRMPTSYVLVGSLELVVPVDLQDKLMDVVLPSFPMVPYDYLAYTEYEKLPGERVKLGVRMSDEDGKVVVEAVVPDSAAAIAGVAEGDIIVALDETPIEENFDLIYAVNQHFNGDRSKLIVERNGERLELDVTFIPLPMTMKGHGKGK